MQRQQKKSNSQLRCKDKKMKVSSEHPHKLEGIIPHKKIVLKNEKYPLIFTLKNKRVFLESVFK